MQTERAVEFERSIGATRRGNRQFAVQIRVVRIAIRRHRGEAVQRAAQNHHHQTPRAAGFREQHAR
jgi:hypothetical protein